MPHKKVTLRVLALSGIACLGVRLFPFHIPNVEPLMALYMPLQKRLGFFIGSIFVIISIVPFDLIMGQFGPWTLINILAYSLLGLLLPLCRRRWKTESFIAKAISGTLFFDGITGLCVGPLFFHQPFMQAFLGQIPFTFIHVASNVLLALSLSPLIDDWIVKQVSKQTRGVCSLLEKKVL